MTTPRGIRNNNPLNIRISNNRWKHKITPSADPAFEQFDTIFWGIRAAFIIIRTYLSRRYRCRTVHDVIARFAPASENDVEKYTDYVCKRAYIPSNEQLEFKNKNQMCRLLWAMAQYENGQEVRFSYFESAYAYVSM